MRKRQRHGRYISWITEISVSSWEGHMDVRLMFRLHEVKFSRAEYKKVCGMVEEDKCLIEGCCKHFVFNLLGVRSVSEI